MALLQQQIASAIVNEDRERTMKLALPMRIELRRAAHGTVVGVDENDLFCVVVHSITRCLSALLFEHMGKHQLFHHSSIDLS